jgi:hypothetical protein
MEKLTIFGIDLQLSWLFGLCILIGIFFIIKITYNKVQSSSKKGSVTQSNITAGGDVVAGDKILK